MFLILWFLKRLFFLARWHLPIPTTVPLTHVQCHVRQPFYIILYPSYKLVSADQVLVVAYDNINLFVCPL